MDDTEKHERTPETCFPYASRIKTVVLISVDKATNYCRMNR